jgi:heme/copper-type cytochrome/quinol oxidase subunit 3
MLFGALFSAYILLRVGAPETGLAAWPATPAEAGLSWKIGAFNTLVLIISSVTMVMAWARLKMKNLSAARGYLAITIGLALLFLIIKIGWEYIPKLQHGHGPAYNNFYATYFTMTGLHALHILGGIVVIGYFLFWGHKLWYTNPEYYTNRIECTGLYWHFVDLVWIFLFPVLYLMN